MEAVPFFLAHLTGDYVIQTDWMAQEKVKRWAPAAVHAVLYTLAYMLWSEFTLSWVALTVIGGTHLVIDRYRLTKRLTWAVNQLSPRRYRFTWQQGKVTGYAPTAPLWLATWLMILVDNTTHLAINWAAVSLL